MRDYFSYYHHTQFDASRTCFKKELDNQQDIWYKFQIKTPSGRGCTTLDTVPVSRINLDTAA